jgi:hypothetical protein
LIILKNGKMLKKHTKQNKNTKKNRLKNQTVVTIIFDGKLWACKRAYRYESLERTPISEYPKIGPWFEIMTSVDADLRSGRRLETGRRSESITYTGIFNVVLLCLNGKKDQISSGRYSVSRLN